MRASPDHPDDDFDSPFADLEPYPSQPAEWDDPAFEDEQKPRGCETAALFLLMAAVIGGSMLMAKLLLEAN
jgi:hypothetical protein